jgi:hypothetical protein
MCWNKHHQTSFPSMNFFFFVSNMWYQLSLTPMSPWKQRNKQHRTDLLQIAGPLESPARCSYTLQGKTWTCKSTVIDSIVTCSLLYIPQDFPLFIIIFLKFSTTASHGSTNSVARWDSIRTKPNDRRFIQVSPRCDTAAMQTPVSPPWCSICCHRKYGPGCTFKNSTYNRTPQ